MYLKKIEVQGFKSFANKLVFEFDNGITAIVGPNGSGKSNIADAVRWVLGEQSAKQLRGSRMEDVIFAGTETRKPVSFAYVSLTIDNSEHQLDIEYDEVTVSRRVYRSGESEYLINGNSCRLKDINELFYDTGIGKEGYSIIGQGQIDKILSGKADERRELFDEAAGIVKYKRRKHTAQKSLDNESQNLIRISDILSELEKQVGPLARQSEKAREFLKLKETLKTLEVNLFLSESDTLKTEISQLEDKLAIVDHEICETTREFESIKTVYDEKDQEIQATAERIDGLTSKLSQGEIDKNRLISQIEILKEQIKSANQNDAHIAERLRGIREQIEEREEEKATLLKQKFDISGESDEVFARQNQADKTCQESAALIQSLTEEIDASKTAIYDNLHNKGVIRTSIQRYETMLEQITIRKAELTGKLLNFKTDEVENDDSLTELKQQIDKVSQEIDSLESENKRLDLLCNELREKRNQQKEQLNREHENLLRNQSKLESLKNIAERYDGYGNSIRRVMECKDREPGLIGVVADIIKTGKQYEIAIETALGGSIQNIVTDNEHTAKRMIAYLKEHKFGRGTFLPLSTITGKSQNRQDLSKEPGFIGYGSQLVETETAYQDLAENLLGRCVVVDHIDHALMLSKKYHYTLRIVTLEGELLNPGGSMTGGAFKNTSNLLGRRREIEDLEAALALSESKISALKAFIEEADQKVQEAKLTLESNKIRIQENKILQNTAEHNYDETFRRHEEIRSKYENNSREEKEIASQIQEITGNLTDLRRQLLELEESDLQLNAKIEEWNRTLEQRKAEYQDQLRIAEAIHIEYSSISQKAGFAEESVKRILREIERLKEGIEDLADNKVDSQLEIDTKNQEIQEISQIIEHAETTLADYRTQLEQEKTKKDQLSQSIKEFFQSREECRDKLNQLEKEQFRLSQSREKAETTRDARIDYMWNEYEITLSQAALMRNEELSDENAMKKQVAELRNDIRKLGDVNVNSIEDYKEVSERYEFLKTQHDDLMIARDKLIDVIGELDKGMRELFTEKFQQIREEYDKVFKQLFGGGKGSIQLEEDVDILEAEITIISQPPGKKLQNMMQLSGGEKALSAISLLFAIQNLKPSPFCLLDEIEAALDDSNVDRYAKYLHKLTANTQFIVITHRRGTMSSADRLYGITMQEKGVSALVSVDLIESQLEEKQEKI